MYRLLVLISFIVTSASCQKKTVQPAKPSVNQPEMKETKTFTYLALGDSYTIGESVEERERYPNILSRLLEKESLFVKPTIIATTGWTTENLADAISNSRSLSSSYDVVSLLIGVNNQYQGKDLSEYKTEFKELLSTAIKLAGNNRQKVFVISIPDYGYTPFGASKQESISREIDLFNEANKQIAALFEVRYFNITPISRKGLTDPTLVAEDGLHPSGSQYTLWAELMYPDIKQIFLK